MAHVKTYLSSGYLTGYQSDASRFEVLGLFSDIHPHPSNRAGWRASPCAGPVERWSGAMFVYPPGGGRPASGCDVTSAGPAPAAVATDPQTTDTAAQGGSSEAGMLSGSVTEALLMTTARLSVTAVAVAVTGGTAGAGRVLRDAGCAAAAAALVTPLQPAPSPSDPSDAA